MTNKDFAFLTPKGKSFNRYDVFTIISDGRFIYVNNKRFEKPAPVFAFEAYSEFFKRLSRLQKFELDFALAESGNLLITSPDKAGIKFECNVKPAKPEKKTEVKPMNIEDKVSIIPVGFETPIDPKAINAKAKLPSRGFHPAVKEYLESKKTTVISPDGHIEKPAESKPITVISAKDGRAYTGKVAKKLIEHMTNNGYTDRTFGTYPQWIKQGRIVMKGQKGLRIETESYSFTVFNKEQTMEVSK